MYTEKVRPFFPSTIPHKIDSYGSAAFRIEYERKFPRAALYKEIESYLGEYRFGVQKYPYELLLGRGIDPHSLVDLRDVNQKESMIKKAARALQKKRDQWRDSSREEADLEGLFSLKQQLETAATGDIVVWASPPGPKEDGFSDYGFVYMGEIEENRENGEKRLYMAAIRIENQTVEQCNRLFSSLSDKQYSFTTPEDFVAHPAVLKNRELSEVELAMISVFDFSIDPQREAQFRESMKVLKPHIQKFIDLVHSGAPKEMLVTVFQALENYALELRSRKERLQQFAGSYDLVLMREIEEKLHFSQMVEKYSKEKPPVIGGSCGSTETDENNSNKLSYTSNIFNKYSTLQKILKRKADDKFECPACHKKSDPPVGDQCPECRITIKEALEKRIIQRACV